MTLVTRYRASRLTAWAMLAAGLIVHDRLAWFATVGAAAMFAAAASYRREMAA